MNFDVMKRTILKVRHGSHAYGLNTPTSDLDIKGVCIEPLEYHLGFLNKFEQYERYVSKGHEEDCVIYSLKKFAHLAADCNPNIIEVLHVEDSDVLQINAWGDMLRERRDDFLSRKAKHTFSGYAHAQLKRIKTHRAWLLDPPKAPPSRKDFGLSEETKISKSELGAYDELLADQVNLDALPKNVTQILIQEKAYHASKTHWDQYLNWVKTRNPARAELEAKHGYDTKHGMHLIRLMRMCREILTEGRVHVKRSDREDLLGIRNGTWSYDRLVQYAEALDLECDELEKTSTLPHSPDRQALDELVVQMTESFLKVAG